MAGRLTACVTLILMMALAAHATAAEFGSAEITLNGQPAPAPSSPVCGLSIVAQGDGPQVAVTAKPAALWRSTKARRS